MMDLPCDPVIPHLGVHPPKLKIESQRDICTLMFIAALFTVDKSWKQPKCSSMKEWINTIVVCTYSGILFSL